MLIAVKLRQYKRNQLCKNRKDRKNNKTVSALTVYCCCVVVKEEGWMSCWGKTEALFSTFIFVSHLASRAKTSFIFAPAEPARSLKLQHATQHALRVFQHVVSLMFPTITCASFNQVFVPLHSSVAFCHEDYQSLFSQLCCKDVFVLSLNNKRRNYIHSEREWHVLHLGWKWEQTRRTISWLLCLFLPLCICQY